MKYYEGTVAEAVTKALMEGAVFGCAIFGEDNDSRELEAALRGDEVQSVLSAGKFICIRIIGNSEVHQQFMQIYANASAPSIYLIGDKGTPLEIVTSPMSSYELKVKFQDAWNRHSASIAEAVTATQNSTTGPATTSVNNQGASASSTSETTSATAQALVDANEAVRVAENAVNQENLSLEEKVERAHRLAAAKREQKRAEEAEDLKRKERERREAGKGMAELKRWQEEQEMKKHLEERKKDKIADKELREKLRQQIAADRAARNARTNVSFLEGPSPSEGQAGSTSSESTRPTGVTTSVPKDYSGQARLQFRLPSGSSISHVFEPTVTLTEVRSFLVNNNHVPFSKFTLSVAYPRREFASSEYSTNLRDLGLVPSAALLVLPISGSGSLPGMAGGGVGYWISLIVSYLMIPFTFILSLVQRALPSSGPSTPPQQPPAAATDKPPRASTSKDASSSNPGAAAAELRNRKNASTKKSGEGNIHRLRTQGEDSDEEKATWNGNSTQQM